MRRKLHCRDVQPLLSDYIDGVLAADAQAAVETHCEACPACEAEAHALAETVRLLRGLPDPETPPMIAANVMRRIRAGETRPGVLGRLWQTIAGALEPRFVLPASAMAVAAVAVIGLQGLPGSSDWTIERDAARVDGPSLVWGGRAEFGPDQAQAGPGRTAGAPRSLLAMPVERSARLEPLGVQGRGGDASWGRSGSFSAAIPVGGPIVPDWGIRAEAGGRFGSGAPVALPVAAPARPGVFGSAELRGRARERDRSGSSGVDVRDQWLAAGLERPLEFARFLSAKSLAEQELWVGRLAARAKERGLLPELTRTLDSTGEQSARLLAEDFRAER